MTSLADAINTKKSYGACRKNHQSVMLTVIDSRTITHKLLPSDTLQGLAIKYGVSVEKIKRANKLWFNESIHMKDSLIIPYERDRNIEKISENTDNKRSSYKNLPQDKKIPDDNQLVAEALNSSGKENDEVLANKNGTSSSTSSSKSDALTSFNEMLNKIDSQIETQKAKNGQQPSRVPPIPVVSYDNNYQNCAALFSPTKQQPFLEYNL